MMLAKGARDHLDSDVRHHPTGSNRWSRSSDASYQIGWTLVR